MFYSELGIVYHFLLKNRVAESKPSGKRRSKKGEAEVVHILKSWDFDDIENFEEFLNAQGLSLHVSTDQDYTGIPTGGKSWMLKRLTSGEGADFLSFDQTLNSISLKDNESKEVSSTWFLHVWLIYLYLIYTKNSRSPDQIYMYEDAFFNEVELVDALHEHIEVVRSQKIDDKTQTHILNILDAEKGADISRRVKGFLESMMRSSLIVKTGDGEYKQTLLGAIEISESYRSIMLGTIVTRESSLSTLSQIASK